MLSLEEIISTMQVHQETLKNSYYVKAIGVFGSYAENRQTEDSDIDFLVDFDKNVVDIFEAKYKLREYLKTLFSKEIDLTRSNSLKPYVKESILGMTKYAI